MTTNPCKIACRMTPLEWVSFRLEGVNIHIDVAYSQYMRGSAERHYQVSLSRFLAWDLADYMRQRKTSPWITFYDGAQLRLVRSDSKSLHLRFNKAEGGVADIYFSAQACSDTEQWLLDLQRHGESDQDITEVPIFGLSC